MPVLLSLVVGTVFGAGLALSDMVNPARVLNFFDLAGSWDPTLAFVMGGALATTFVGYRLVFARGASLTGGSFNLPTAKQVDLPLVGGAALFGLGWGLAGFCPGPALAALVSLKPQVFLFVAATAAGMVATRAWRGR
ncbi:MAG: YeeE/YedE family protein [Rhizobiales bacterium]|nr:YeeE/YedE family protein [Hyphomicrobiales bacterium]MBI3672901.1 YeeE/YedE family protein [Hyphomicrobiales bacterium]